MKKTLITADNHGKHKELFEYAVNNDVATILQCGDLEPIRSLDDLEHFPAPSKFVREYMSGERSLEFAEYLKGVPVPTYTISGNHEPFGWLEQFRSKGVHELVPNFYYFGNYGVAEIDTGVGKLTVAGFSKIFHEEHSLAENFESWHPKRRKICSPKRAAYFNETDIHALIDVCRGREVDILLLHENPANYHGNKLEYGCDLITDLVKALAPKVAFCGHMHFAAERMIGGTLVVNLPINEYFILEERWGYLWEK